MYTADQVAQACRVPLAATQANWPLLTAAMREFGIWTPGTGIAIAANVAVETAWTFRPIEEYGNEGYWRGELGLDWQMHGRGFNQETWTSGYAWAAQATGIDCLNHPELLLVPVNSARVTAAFVKMKGIPAQAEAHNWTEVRRLWNGGSNGLPDVLGCVTRLLDMPYPPDESPLKGKQFHVVTRTDLLTKPQLGAPLAIDQNHHHVTLPVGTLVIATGETTPHWLELTLPGGPVHGWVQRGTLRA